MRKELKAFFTSNKKKIIISVGIILILIIVYKFSSMDYFKTNNVSKNFIKNIIKIIYPTGDNAKLNMFVNRANTLVRKMAHLFLFLSLGAFISTFTKLKYKLEPKYNTIVLIICSVCGAIDEIHQSFVPGRSSKFSDVIIDTIGAFIGIMIINILYKKIKPRILKLTPAK